MQTNKVGISANEKHFNWSIKHKLGRQDGKQILAADDRTPINEHFQEADAVYT